MAHDYDIHGTDLAERVRVRQMEIFIRQIPVMAAAQAVCAAFVALASWDMVPTLFIAGWIMAIWLAWGSLAVLWWTHRRRSALQAVGPDTIRRTMLRVAVSGALWGFAGVALFPNDSFVQQVILTFVVGGLCAGAVATLSSFPAVCHAYVLTSATPLIVSYLLAGNRTSAIMGSLLVVFAIALLLISRNGYRMFLDGMQVEQENRNLLRKFAHARDEAEAANRAKTQFLANMSHELRTPLNAILGFSEILERQMFGPLGADKYRDYVGDIHASGVHLLQVINDILDISKIEAGQMELTEEDLDVRAMIDAAIGMTRERAHHAGVDVAVRVQPGLPALRGDERAVKQMLLNLLTNAIKFTPSGGKIRVAAQLRPGGGLEISVADNGIGIDEADLPTVLAKFGQVENAFTRTSEGTGLGLPLTKRLIELHGGLLVIESAPDVGTTVTLRFAANRTVAVPETPEAPPMSA